VSRLQVGVRLAALVVVALVAVSFILFDVLGIRIGAQPFPVTVLLPRGGGLYADAFVTYRGVDVGRVASLELSSTGAVATLSIDPGTRIPSDTNAQVRELSVAGEQYLDLVPSSAGGPMLHAGSVIAQSRTKVPVSVFTLLNDAGRLIGSINAGEVSTVTKALGTGFAGTGSDLRTITVTAQHLVDALQAAQASTVTILDGGGTLLSTAMASRADLEQISQSLDQITSQLAASNADVVALLANGVPAEQAIDQTIAQDGAQLSLLITHLAAVSDAAISQQPAVQSLLAQLPIFVNKIADTVSGGAVQVQLNYNNADAVCPYILGAETAEPTAPTGPPTLNRTCNLTAADLLQRGAANAPVAPGG
jgi:phospholipid/cholesterol/gamma-HCH transport system substrate-binding protein